MLTFLKDEQLDEEKKLELLQHVTIQKEYLANIDLLKFLEKCKFFIEFQTLNLDKRKILLTFFLQKSINAPDLKIPFYHLFQHLRASEKSAFVDTHLADIKHFLSSKNSDVDFPDLFNEFFQDTSNKLKTSSIFRKLSSEKSSTKKTAIFDHFRQILALSNQLTANPQQKDKIFADMAELNARFINTHQNPPLKIYQHLANFFMIMFFRLDLILSYSCGYDILYSRSNDITKQIQEIYTEMTSEAITSINGRRNRS